MINNSASLDEAKKAYGLQDVEFDEQTSKEIERQTQMHNDLVAERNETEKEQEQAQAYQQAKTEVTLDSARESNTNTGTTNTGTTDAPTA
jgi:hypothetical protein